MSKLSRAKNMSRIFFSSCIVCVLVSLASYSASAADDYSGGRVEQFYIGLGIGLYEQQNYDEALNRFNMALSINSDNPVTLRYIGKIYYDKGMHDKAMPYFKESLKFGPDIYETHICMAEVYQAKGQDRLARDHYEKALSFDKDNAKLHLRLIDLFKQDDSYQEIVTYARQALNIKELDLEDEIELYIWLGYAHAGLGDYTGAVNSFMQASGITRDPQEVNWLLSLVYILKAKSMDRKYDSFDALEEVDRVLEFMGRK